MDGICLGKNCSTDNLIRLILPLKIAACRGVKGVFIYFMFPCMHADGKQPLMHARRLGYMPDGYLHVCSHKTCFDACQLMFLCVKLHICSFHESWGGGGVGTGLRH
jgi:hypothetical protein